MRLHLLWRCARSSRQKLLMRARHLYRSSARLLSDWCSSECVQYTTVFLVLTTSCCAFFLWLYFRDPCFTWEIKKRVCHDYRNGLSAGSLCYDFCVEETVPLSHCIKVTKESVTFRWSDMVIRAQLEPERTTEKPRKLPAPNAVWEGMTYEDYWNLLEDFFLALLGTEDHTPLISRLVDFTDFNRDEKLTFGEVNSVWKLLQIQEFRTLYIFQENSVFPKINSTCGDMYAYQFVGDQVLYNKSRTSFWDLIFPRRFRWHFPSWLKRVNIGIGLLEYAAAALEESGARFHMCDLSPSNFGYTDRFEAKVTSMEGIISQPHLKFLLQRRQCQSDSMCVYKEMCQSRCNLETSTCSGDILRPDLGRICEIIKEYISHDAPSKLKGTLNHLISKCTRLRYTEDVKNNSRLDLEQNLLIDQLTDQLWSLVRDQPDKWWTNKRFL